MHADTPYTWAKGQQSVARAGMPNGEDNVESFPGSDSSRWPYPDDRLPGASESHDTLFHRLMEKQEMVAVKQIHVKGIFCGPHVT